MSTNFKYVAPAYKNCGASGGQEQAFAAERSFQQTALSMYQSVLPNSEAALTQIGDQLATITAGGPGQQGFSPEELAARNGQTLNEAAAANKQIQANIAEKGVMASGGGAGTTLGSTTAAEAGAEAQVLNNAANQLQKTTAENYATGRQNWQYATEAGAKVAGEEVSATATAAEPVTGAEKLMSDQANQNAAANSSWMGLVGGIASSFAGGLGGGIGKKIGGG